MCGQLNPLSRDFHRLLKNVKKLTNSQVKVLDYEDDICEFTLEIKPIEGFYKKGKFEFKIEPKDYPHIAPRVQCLTDIYHPNINSEYERDVCLSLFDEWTAQNDFEDCVQGLLFLLYNPNLEDPLNPYFDPTSDEQIGRFAEDVAASLEGGDVEGFYYERNIAEEVKLAENAEEYTTGFDRDTTKTEAGRQAAYSTTTAPPFMITAIEATQTTQPEKTDELQSRIVTPQAMGSTAETTQRTRETQNASPTISTKTTELAATEKNLLSTEKATQTVPITTLTTCDIKTT